MSQWDVEDVVELLWFYRVPNYALNFAYRHSIDGDSMDEGVEHIVKDLKINHPHTEEAIVEKWREVSSSGLSPQEALKYGTNKLPLVESSNALSIHYTPPKEINLTANSGVVNVSYLEGTAFVNNKGGDDDMDNSKVKFEEVERKSCLEELAPNDSKHEQRVVAPSIGNPVSSNAPGELAKFSVDGMFPPEGNEADDYGNDFEADEEPAASAPSAPLTSPTIATHLNTHTHIPLEVAKIQESSYGELYSDFETSEDSGNVVPRRQNPHTTTPPSKIAGDTVGQGDDLAATIEKQTREYEQRRKQQRKLHREHHGLQNKQEQEQLQQNRQQHGTLRRVDTEESVHTEASLLYATARDKEAAEIKHQLEKYRHEMVQQSELLRLQEERIKLQDMLLQKQRGTIASLSPRKEYSIIATADVNQRYNRAPTYDEGDPLHYDDNGHFSPHIQESLKSYPPHLLYDSISQLSGSDIFDAPANTYSARRSAAAHAPLVSSSVTSTNSAEEQERSNLVPLHFRYGNQSFPHSLQENVTGHAFGEENMVHYAQQPGVVNGTKRPVSGGGYRTVSAGAQWGGIPAASRHTEDVVMDVKIPTAYSAYNKRRDCGHLLQEPSAHDNLHRDLYQGSTDSAGNVWHHHNHHHRQQQTQEPMEIVHPVEQFPLRNGVFVPQLPLLSVLAADPTQDNHPHRHHQTGLAEVSSVPQRQHLVPGGSAADPAVGSGAPVRELVTLIKELSECNRALLQAIRPSSAPSSNSSRARRSTIRASRIVEPQQPDPAPAMTSRSGPTQQAENSPAAHHHLGGAQRPEWNLSLQPQQNPRNAEHQRRRQAGDSPRSQHTDGDRSIPAPAATAKGVRYTTEQAIATIIKKLQDSPYRSRPSSSTGTRTRPKSSNGTRAGSVRCTAAAGAGVDGQTSSTPPSSRIQEYVEKLVLELAAKDAVREMTSAYEPPAGPPVPADNHWRPMGSLQPETVSDKSGLLSVESGAASHHPTQPRTFVLLRNGSGTIRDGPRYLRPRERNVKSPVVERAISSSSSRPRSSMFSGVRRVRKESINASSAQSDGAPMHSAAVVALQAVTNLADPNGSVGVEKNAVPTGGGGDANSAGSADGKAVLPKKPSSRLPSWSSGPSARGRKVKIPAAPNHQQ